MPVFMRLLTLFFDQKIRLWRCGELNSGLKGILIPFYHYSQLFNLIFSLIEQGEAGKRQTQVFYLTQQGFGFLLRSALLLAGVSSKVSYWLESLSVSFNKFSSLKERFSCVSIFLLIDFRLSQSLSNGSWWVRIPLIKSKVTPITFQV